MEFTVDGSYMVWFEGTDTSGGSGIVWHCGVNPKTGDLIPPDGRGFRAFESTSWGRANPGYDRLGPYYVGADQEGKLRLVRPESPTKGQVVTLATPPDPRRRAIYPTSLPERDGGFVFFIQNEKTPGAGMRANENTWVELQYISLSEPTKVRPIERQETPRFGFAPMDTGFARWMRRRPLLTFGALSKTTGKVEVRVFDADAPGRGAVDVIMDGYTKIDPYPAALGDFEYVFAGIDATATSHIYRRPAGQAADAPFALLGKLSPSGTRLAEPSLAQSHEPFMYNGGLYTVYQINNRGRGFFDTTFRQPGELWLADLSREPIRQWLIAPDEGGVVAEPEPLATAHGVWVFYTCPILEEVMGDQSGGTPPAAPSGRWRERLRQRRGTLPGRRQPMPRFALFRAELPIRATTSSAVSACW
ncbi:MAG: hypothetical protein SNJ62_01765 [Chloracidobacterium sp.]